MKREDRVGGQQCGPLEGRKPQSVWWFAKKAINVIKVSEGDFPGGPEVKGLPYNARN